MERRTYMNKRPYFFVLILLFSTHVFSVDFRSTTYTSEMRNVLSTTGEGNGNNAYGQRINNILIFQAGGWSGLAMGTPGIDSTWPLHWGKQGYLEKNNNTLLWQMHEIKNLNKTAIAVLFMPPSEAASSGYGACWDGRWVTDRICNGGKWSNPQELFANVKWAAWMKGIQVAPLISINNNDKKTDVKIKLTSFVDWYMSTVDNTTLKTVDGKVVILTEGLPGNTKLSDQQKADILSYMGSKTNIFWIDNLVADQPSATPGNIYRSAATTDTTGSVQDALKSVWGKRYLWHFVDRSGKKASDLAANTIPESVRLKWLNIMPHGQNSYPVVISQWNEYSEYLTFEPNMHDGYNEYYYLRWRLGQQP
jgi:hypothetical protein